MSRRLPLDPNLEHLRKQAKNRLRMLKEQNPGAKLTNAQLDIAREYGFASWPRLMAHVESLTPTETASTGDNAAQPSQGGRAGRGSSGTTVAAGEPPSSHYVFHRYTDKAKQATFFSRYEAGQLGASRIEPEHLLLGLIRASLGLKSQLFERAQLSLDDVRAELRPIGREPTPLGLLIPFSDATRPVLRAAVEEADRLGHHDIGIAHLLLGLLREQPPLPSLILESRGIRLDSVRDDIERLRDEGYA